MCDSMSMPLLFSPTGVGVLEGVGLGGMKEPELHERGGKEFRARVSRANAGLSQSSTAVHLLKIGGTGSKCISKMAALKHGSRKFYEIPSEELTHFRHSYKLKKETKVKELITYIEESCIGKDVMFTGPYGLRKGKLVKNSIF